jgi:multidrug efflux system membrane fusion protein
VVTGRVVQKDIPVELSAIGNVEANTTISVRAQVSGVLQQVFFDEGDFVKSGDKLFQLDARPYDAALKQAEANLVRDQALLNQANAQLKRDASNAEYSQIASERQAQLVAKGIISKDVAEQARAAADAAKGTIDADRANIESAQAQYDAQVAAVDNAKLMLAYTTITSPLAGRTGNLTVKAGNLVNANSTELMTIAQIEPVNVTFTAPAVNLPAIKKYMAEGQVIAIATPQDQEAQPVTGVLRFVDNAVDTSTDTIKMKATFDNKDRRLWPGQFARVNLRLTTLKDALVVPSQTVQIGQDGQFVFVVKPDFTVEQRTVKTAQRSDADTVIADGLKLGEQVVVEGQLRLEPGTRITIADGKDVGGGNRGGGNRGGRGGNGNGGNGNGGNGGGNRGGGQGGGGGQRGQ